jgi:hypothetical protein
MRTKQLSQKRKKGGRHFSITRRRRQKRMTQRQKKRRRSCTGGDDTLKVGDSVSVPHNATKIPFFDESPPSPNDMNVKPYSSEKKFIQLDTLKLENGSRQVAIIIDTFHPHKIQAIGPIQNLQRYTRHNFYNQQPDEYFWYFHENSNLRRDEIETGIGNKTIKVYIHPSHGVYFLDELEKAPEPTETKEPETDTDENSVKGKLDGPLVWPTSYDDKNVILGEQLFLKPCGKEGNIQCKDGYITIAPNKDALKNGNSVHFRKSTNGPAIYSISKDNPDPIDAQNIYKDKSTGFHFQIFKKKSFLSKFF